MENYRGVSYETILAWVEGGIGYLQFNRPKAMNAVNIKLLDEAYEAVDAIDNRDMKHLKEELGDVLLQVVLHSQIAEDSNVFNIDDVAKELNEKLIRRHPHVFGDVCAETSEQVLKNWEQIKVSERKERKEDSSVIAGIPRGLPALLRSYRIQERAAKVGFDWPQNDLQPVLDKVEEELCELKEAIKKSDSENISEELGDLLFATVNLSRHLKEDPEITLHKACHKFSARFRNVENSVIESGREWSTFSLDELEVLWQKAKTKEIQTH